MNTRFSSLPYAYKLDMSSTEGAFLGCVFKGNGGEERPECDEEEDADHDDDDDDDDSDGGDISPIQPSNCGVTKYSTRIVGGQDAQPNEYPWMVALQLGKKTNIFLILFRYFFCGNT